MAKEEEVKNTSVTLDLSESVKKLNGLLENFMLEKTDDNVIVDDSVDIMTLLKEKEKKKKKLKQDQCIQWGTQFLKVVEKKTEADQQFSFTKLFEFKEAQPEFYKGNAQAKNISRQRNSEHSITLTYSDEEKSEATKLTQTQKFDQLAYALYAELVTNAGGDAPDKSNIEEKNKLPFIDLSNITPNTPAAIKAAYDSASKYFAEVYINGKEYKLREVAGNDDVSFVADTQDVQEKDKVAEDDKTKNSNLKDSAVEEDDDTYDDVYDDDSERKMKKDKKRKKIKKTLRNVSEEEESYDADDENDSDSEQEEKAVNEQGNLTTATDTDGNTEVITKRMKTDTERVDEDDSIEGKPKETSTQTEENEENEKIERLKKENEDLHSKFNERLQMSMEDKNSLLDGLKEAEQTIKRLEKEKSDLEVIGKADTIVNQLLNKKVTEKDVEIRELETKLEVAQEENKAAREKKIQKESEIASVRDKLGKAELEIQGLQKDIEKSEQAKQELELTAQTLGEQVSEQEERIKNMMRTNEKKLKSQENANSSQSNTIIEQEKKIGVLKGELEAASKRAKEAESAATVSDKKAEEANAEISKLKTEVGEKNSFIVELQQGVYSSNQETQVIQGQLESQTLETETLQSDLAIQKEQNSKQVETIREQKKMITSLGSNLETQRNENGKLSKVTAEQINSLEKELQAARKKELQSQEIIKELQSQLAEQKKVNSKQTETQKAVLGEQSNQMRSIKEKAKKDKAESQKMILKAEAETKTLKAKLEKLKKENSQRTVNAEETANEIGELKQSLQAANNQVKEAKDKAEQAKTADEGKISDLENKLMTQEKANTQLTHELEEANQRAKHAESAATVSDKKAEEATARDKEAKADTKSLKAKLEEMTTKYDNACISAVAWKKDSLSKDAKINKLKNQLHEMKNHQVHAESQIGALKQVIEKLKDQTDQLQQHNSLLLKGKTDSDEQVQTLTNKTMENEKQAQELKEELEATEVELSKWKKYSEDLNSHYKNQQENTAQKQVSTSSTSTQTNHVNSLEKKIEKLATSNKEKDEAIKLLEEQIRKLESTIKEMQQKPKAKRGSNTVTVPEHNTIGTCGNGSRLQYIAGNAAARTKIYYGITKSKDGHVTRYISNVRSSLQKSKFKSNIVDFHPYEKGGRGNPTPNRKNNSNPNDDITLDELNHLFDCIIASGDSTHLNIIKDHIQNLFDNEFSRTGQATHLSSELDNAFTFIDEAIKKNQATVKKSPRIFTNTTKKTKTKKPSALDLASASYHEQQRSKNKKGPGQ